LKYFIFFDCSGCSRLVRARVKDLHTRWETGIHRVIALNKYDAHGKTDVDAKWNKTIPSPCSKTSKNGPRKRWLQFVQLENTRIQYILYIREKKQFFKCSIVINYIYAFFIITKIMYIMPNKSKFLYSNI
jgi:hypothetical protein